MGPITEMAGTLMKLLSRQTNMVEGHSKGVEEQEVDMGRIIQK